VDSFCHFYSQALILQHTFHLLVTLTILFLICTMSLHIISRLQSVLAYNMISTLCCFHKININMYKYCITNPGPYRFSWISVYVPDRQTCVLSLLIVSTSHFLTTDLTQWRFFSFPCSGPLATDTHPEL
jgi:hypothetical protein